MDDPLWTAGCAWLGRDPERDVAVEQPTIEDIETVTDDPRVYGFHCTLKQPFRLATPYGDFRDDLAQLARAIQSFEMPALRIMELSGFLALGETEASAQLQATADLCVAWLDRHRAPPTTAELQRYRGESPRPEAEALLMRWGYPAVFGRWRFHMTLTKRLSPELLSILRPHSERHFAATLSRPRRFQSVCVFIQVRSGAPFLLAERVRIG